MEKIETKLIKLVADDGKVLVRKDWVQEYDENKNPIPRDTYKTIYLAINDSPENYEEIDEIIESEV